MKYQVIERETSKVEFEAYTSEEAEEVVEFDYSWDTHCVIQFFECKGHGCDEEGFERYDWYGISTGHYCDKCYETNYPYKKERYATEEYDGYGERLDTDY